MSRELKAKSVRAAVIKLAAKDSSLNVNELRIILALERVVALGRDLDDGFWFGDIQVESLDAQGEYGALRFNSAFQIGDPPAKKDAIRKLSRIHFDVGFGDALPKRLPKSEMPLLIQGEESVSWRVYPPEYIFSEKLQTLVARASANSRAKDVHDLTILYKICDAEKLQKAIQQTFKRRSTELPSSFRDYAKDLDTRLLETSWKSVQIGSGEATFSETWKRLQTVLAKLDSDLKK